MSHNGRMIRVGSRWAVAALVAAMLVQSVSGCKKEPAASAETSAGGTPANATPAAAPARPAPRMVGNDIELYDIAIGGSGPGRPMRLNLYLPAGRHEAKSLPCVLIAPAGSAMHGMALADGDRPEHYPYVRAGFAVMAYELSGSVADPRAQRATYADILEPIKQFMHAEGGLANARIAIDYVLAQVPEVDPQQFYTSGHSSAAVVALNVARADNRIRACCAYAPPADVEQWWNDPKLSRLIPDFPAFAARSSPLRNAAEIKCPVYLFHADDDSTVDLASNQKLADALRAAGKTVFFDRVRTGGHYDAMIQQGIPHGIGFMQSLGARLQPPRPGSAAGPAPSANVR